MVGEKKHSLDQGRFVQKKKGGKKVSHPAAGKRKDERKVRGAVPNKAGSSNARKPRKKE